MSKYSGRVDNTPPPGLDDDVADCLKFLIAHQDEWKPEMHILRYSHSYRIPMILMTDEAR